MNDGNMNLIEKTGIVINDPIKYNEISNNNKEYIIFYNNKIYINDKEDTFPNKCCGDESRKCWTSTVSPIMKNILKGYNAYGAIDKYYINYKDTSIQLKLS